MTEIDLTERSDEDMEKSAQDLKANSAVATSERIDPQNNQQNEEEEAKERHIGSSEEIELQH